MSIPELSATLLGSMRLGSLLGKHVKSPIVGRNQGLAEFLATIYNFIDFVNEDEPDKPPNLQRGERSLNQTLEPGRKKMSPLMPTDLSLFGSNYGGDLAENDEKHLEKLVMENPTLTISGAKSVCDCLLRRGSLSLDELRKFTKVPTSQVKECLLVLIQHNCVQAFSIPEKGNFGGDLGTVTQYMALFDNILHRLRFPKFSIIVENHLGEQCASLFRGVLQNGRVTFNQLVDRDQAGSKGARDRETLREDFNKLIQARYVERCPKPDPFIAPDLEEDAPAKKRGSKLSILCQNLRKLSSYGYLSFVADVHTIEKQAVAEATLFEAERFREIRPRVQCGGEESVEHNDNVTVGEKEDLADHEIVETNGSLDRFENGRAKTDENASMDSGRKHEKLEIDDETQATISENEVVWRPNYEKFIGNLRNQRMSKAGLNHSQVPVGSWAATVKIPWSEGIEGRREVRSRSILGVWNEDATLIARWLSQAEIGDGEESATALADGGSDCIDLSSVFHCKDSPCFSQILGAGGGVHFCSP
ncbi:hypothetical protein QJS04_geneDACA017093 [Acorus gramineus]|uniref:DNA-directed RNA polymerase III subunit RPC3 n=1 Tax=Acorus gramineus TaxID=55184 RepID=A0AAV9AWZ1_ACOGR|nr:hypothetical protein QJS04_geneDACA017093 [Acorus gramineus]